MRLVWGEYNPYSMGVDHGVAYMADSSIYPWGGLVTANEKADDTINLEMYYDGRRFAFSETSEDFALTVGCFSYPEKIETMPFGFSYRNDKKIHLVWNATALPSEKGHATLGETPEPYLFSWDLATAPANVPGAKPSAHMVVDTETAPEAALEALEELLYGSESSDPTWPTPAEVIDIFLDYAVLIIVNHGDGTWTATGPDDMVHMLDDTMFEIVSPSVIYIDTDKYTVSSY